MSRCLNSGCPMYPRRCPAASQCPGYKPTVGVKLPPRALSAFSTMLELSPEEAKTLIRELQSALNQHTEADEATGKRP